MSEENQGVTRFAGRSAALRAESASQSQAKPAATNAGDWVVFESWNVQAREITKVTPKLFKLGGGAWRYPTQIGRDKAIAVLPDEDAALRFKDALAGINGEFNRRRRAADDDRSKRMTAASEARDKQIAALTARIASGIVAATAGETACGLDERSEADHG